MMCRVRQYSTWIRPYVSKGVLGSTISMKTLLRGCKQDSLHGCIFLSATQPERAVIYKRIFFKGVSTQRNSWRVHATQRDAPNQDHLVFCCEVYLPSDLNPETHKLHQWNCLECCDSGKNGQQVFSNELSFWSCRTNWNASVPEGVTVTPLCYQHGKGSGLVHELNVEPFGAFPPKRNWFGPWKVGSQLENKKIRSFLHLKCDLQWSCHNLQVGKRGWRRQQWQKVVWGLELHSYNCLQFGCSTSSIDNTSYIAMVLLKIAGNEGWFVRWHKGLKTLEQNHIKDQS